MRMQKLLWLAILTLLLTWCGTPMQAQSSTRDFRYVSVDPAGACLNGTANQYNFTNNKEWGCENGTWVVVNGSGGPGNVSALGTFINGDFPKVSGTDGKTQIDSGINAASLTTVGQGAVAGLPGTCVVGDLYFFTNSLYTARCSSVNTWSYFFPALGLVTPPTSSGWTWGNQGSCTIDSTNGYEFMSCPATGSTTNSARIRYKAAAGTFTVTGCLEHNTAGIDGSYASFGLWFGDGTKWVSFNVLSTPGTSSVAGDGIQLVESEWTTLASYSTTRLNWPSSVVTVGDAVRLAMTRSPVCLQLVFDGTTMIYNITADGFHWKQFDSRSATSFVSAVTNIGYGANPLNNPVDIALIHWTGP